MSTNDTVKTRTARLRLWLNMLRTARVMENELREHMRVSYGQTLPRFEILAVLQRSESGMRMSELSEQLMVSNGNVTGIIERLVQDGLVERLPVPGDKRATIVRLTHKGEAVFADMADVHAIKVDELLSTISAEEAEALSQRLTDIRRANRAPIAKKQI